MREGSSADWLSSSEEEFLPPKFPFGISPLNNQTETKKNGPNPAGRGSAGLYGLRPFSLFFVVFDDGFSASISATGPFIPKK
jgi:hypothetical protein